MVLDQERALQSFFFLLCPFDYLLKIKPQEVADLAKGYAALRLHYVQRIDLNLEECSALFRCQQVGV